MNIETARLTLRPFKESDAEEWHHLTKDEYIQHYVPGTTTTSTKNARQIIKTYYMNGDFKRDFYLAIVLKETNQLIGAIIATTNSDYDLDTCYVIGKEYRQQGYMKEALKAFRENLQHIDLMFIVSENNKASIRLLKSIGACQGDYDIKGKKQFWLFN